MWGERRHTSEAVAACSAAGAGALERHVDWSLTDVLRGGGDLTRVDGVQLSMLADVVAIAELWRTLGVEPPPLIGHSQGVIAAPTVAGALSLEDGARVAALRSQAILAIAG
ncbi:hypothetical protein VM98_35910, partial [Streptomyces rubellomurinus subsp. indigoferus]